MYFPQSRGRKPKVKVAADPVSGEEPLPGSRQLSCSRVLPVGRLRELCGVGSLLKGTDAIQEGPTFMT